MSSEIAAAARILQQGGLVAFPTETVYGLGANGLDPVAAARIFEAKRRPAFDPLILHVLGAEELAGVTASTPGLARLLIEHFWPGPLTLVLPKSEAVPAIVTSGLDTVAVRSPAHPVARELLRSAGLPLAAPSANSFGSLSPTRAQHVRDDLGDAVDMVLDGGDCEWGVESTIVDATGEVPVVLRYGALSLEEIERVVGGVEVDIASSSKPSSPGKLDKHYSPRTSLVRVHAGDAPTADPSAAYLAFRRAPEGFGASAVLSPTGDLVEAASLLFERLHELDRAGVNVIYAESVPDEGVGRAINDRLRRASA